MVISKTLLSYILITKADIDIDQLSWLLQRNEVKLR